MLLLKLIHIVRSIMDDKVLSSKIDSNTWLFVATFLDFKEFVLKKFNYRYSIENLITFIINISNIVEFGVRYYYCTPFLLLFLACSFDFQNFTFRSSS